jgi:hypothetical protein
LVKKTKNPRLLWQSRVLEIICALEFRSHDAQKTGVALANGHPAIDRRMLHQFGKRGFHFFNRA